MHDVVLAVVKCVSGLRRSLCLKQGKAQLQLLRLVRKKGGNLQHIRSYASHSNNVDYVAAEASDSRTGCSLLNLGKGDSCLSCTGCSVFCEPASYIS